MHDHVSGIEYRRRSAGTSDGVRRWRPWGGHRRDGGSGRFRQRPLPWLPFANTIWLRPGVDRVSDMFVRIGPITVMKVLDAYVDGRGITKFLSRADTGPRVDQGRCTRCCASRSCSPRAGRGRRASHGNPWTRTRRACTCRSEPGSRSPRSGSTRTRGSRQPSRRCASRARTDPGSLADHDARVATVRRGAIPERIDGPLGRRARPVAQAAVRAGHHRGRPRRTSDARTHRDRHRERVVGGALTVSTLPGVPVRLAQPRPSTTPSHRSLSPMTDCDEGGCRRPGTRP